MAKQKQSADAIRRAWLRQHAAGEKLLARELGKFFKAQTARVYAAALKAGDALSPAAIPQLFDAAAERDAMMAAIAEPLIAMMATGAEQVMRSRPKGKPKGSKAVEDFAELVDNALEEFSFSDDLKTAIADAFDDLQSQDYWADIQENISESIVDALTTGMEEGLSGRKLAKRLAEILGAESETRAKAIATTETTGAYASGQQASYSELAADGVAIRKEWLSIVDDDTRASHVDANGQIVGVDEEFSVGGSKAPYPGAAGLPAKERVNCRCTTSGVFE